MNQDKKPPAAPGKNLPPAANDSDKPSEKSLTLMVNNGRIVKPLHSVSTTQMPMDEIEERFDAIRMGCVYDAFKMGLTIPTFSINSVDIEPIKAEVTDAAS